MGPILSADDSLSPFKLQQSEQLDLLLVVFDRYIRVNGLSTVNQLLFASTPRRAAWSPTKRNPHPENRTASRDDSGNTRKNPERNSLEKSISKP